jgi:hypothetical protein
VCPEVVEIECGARPEHHDGTDNVAVPRIRCSERRRFHDRRMGVQDILDLVRRDGLAAADDDVLDPVGDGESALGIEVAEIACAKPADADRRARQRLAVGPQTCPLGLAVVRAGDRGVLGGPIGPEGVDACGGGAPTEFLRDRRCADKKFAQCGQLRQGRKSYSGVPA